ncbi:MAG: zf-HC2 domain-containing protein [Gemmatimonadaceae bacterium]
MEADASTHPDDGTIHAWLDDALDAATAARIAAHVRDCPECAERVAEARGLIAGASRIVGALDDVPAGTRPAWAQDATVDSGPSGRAVPFTSAQAKASTTDASLWRWLRVTPARAAIAATLIVALGITMTRQRTGLDTPESVQVSSSRSASAPTAELGDSGRAAGGAGAGASAQGAMQAPQATPAPDHLLDSAVAKSLAIGHPQRSMSAAKDAAIPQAPANAAAASTPVDSLAGMRVAEGRSALQRQRVIGRDERADKVRTGAAAAAAPPAAAEAVTAAKAADASVARGERSSFAGGSAMRGDVAGTPTGCYQLASAAAGATWGGEPLPLTVAVDLTADAATPTARLFSADGRPSSLQARWLRTTRDSVRLTLARPGYTGTIELGPELAGGRTGLARSGPSSVNSARTPSEQAAAPERAMPVTLRPAGCPSR